MCCRKALHLLRHVVHAHPPDAALACHLGALQQAAPLLASADDDTWQAALALVQQLAQDTDSLHTIRQVSVGLHHRFDPHAYKQQGDACLKTFRGGNAELFQRCKQTIFLQTICIGSVGQGPFHNVDTGNFGYTNFVSSRLSLHNGSMAAFADTHMYVYAHMNTRMLRMSTVGSLP